MKSSRITVLPPWNIRKIMVRISFLPCWKFSNSLPSKICNFFIFFWGAPKAREKRPGDEVEALLSLICELDNRFSCFFFVCQGNNLENLEDKRDVMVRQILNDVSAFDLKPRYIFSVSWIQSLLWLFPTKPKRRWSLLMKRWSYRLKRRLRRLSNQAKQR